MRRIVVGVDGSAWLLPASAHGSLVVTNFHPLATKKAYRDEAQAVATGVVDAVDLEGVRHGVWVVEGLAGDSLVDAGRDASMIVVGHRGRRRLAQFVLGSTAQYVSRHSVVPVVVVPDGAQPARAAASWAVEPLRGARPATR